MAVSLIEECLYNKKPPPKGRGFSFFFRFFRASDFKLSHKALQVNGEF